MESYVAVALLAAPIRGIMIKVCCVYMLHATVQSRSCPFLHARVRVLNVDSCTASHHHFDDGGCWLACLR
jgi:hypothetical protein